MLLLYLLSINFLSYRTDLCQIWFYVDDEAYGFGMQ